MQIAIPIPPPDLLPPKVQRNSHDDRKHGDGKLHHKHSNEPILRSGRKIKDPIRQAKAQQVLQHRGDDHNLPADGFEAVDGVGDGDCRDRGDGES